MCLPSRHYLSLSSLHLQNLTENHRGQISEKAICTISQGEGGLLGPDSGQILVPRESLKEKYDDSSICSKSVMYLTEDLFHSTVPCLCQKPLKKNLESCLLGNSFLTNAITNTYLAEFFSQEVGSNTILQGCLGPFKDRTLFAPDACIRISELFPPAFYLICETFRQRTRYTY